MEQEINAVYGIEEQSTTLFIYDGWYVCEGSVNVNKAPFDFEFIEGVNIELIEDIDCFTASEPINSMEELISFIDE